MNVSMYHHYLVMCIDDIMIVPFQLKNALTVIYLYIYYKIKLCSCVCACMHTLRIYIIIDFCA